MKKLIVAAFAAMLGIAANAAAVTWTVSPVVASPDAAAAAGWAIYVMDASTFDAFAALSGTEVAAYAADNALYSGATAAGRGGVIGAAVKNGDFDVFNFAADERTFFKHFLIVFLPVCNLLNTSSWVFIKRDVVFFNKLGIFALDVEHIVLCVVFT